MYEHEPLLYKRVQTLYFLSSCIARIYFFFLRPLQFFLRPPLKRARPLSPSSLTFVPPPHIHPLSTNTNATSPNTTNKPLFHNPKLQRYTTSILPSTKLPSLNLPPSHPFSCSSPSTSSFNYYNSSSSCSFDNRCSDCSRCGRGEYARRRRRRRRWVGQRNG